MKTIHEELRARLESWMRETADPLLQGFIPGPDGTRIRDRDRGH